MAKSHQMGYQTDVHCRVAKMKTLINPFSFPKLMDDGIASNLDYGFDHGNPVPPREHTDSTVVYVNFRQPKKPAKAKSGIESAIESILSDDMQFLRTNEGIKKVVDGFYDVMRGIDVSTEMETFGDKTGSTSRFWTRAQKKGGNGMTRFETVQKYISAVNENLDALLDMETRAADPRSLAGRYERMKTQMRILMEIRDSFANSRYLKKNDIAYADGLNSALAGFDRMIAAYWGKMQAFNPDSVRERAGAMVKAYIETYSPAFKNAAAYGTISFSGSISYRSNSWNPLKIFQRINDWLNRRSLGRDANFGIAQNVYAAMDSVLYGKEFSANGNFDDGMMKFFYKNILARKRSDIAVENNALELIKQSFSLYSAATSSSKPKYGGVFLTGYSPMRASS